MSKAVIAGLTRQSIAFGMDFLMDARIRSDQVRA
jgi:hypothetical protein